MPLYMNIFIQSTLHRTIEHYWKKIWHMHIYRHNLDFSLRSYRKLKTIHYRNNHKLKWQHLSNIIRTSPSTGATARASNFNIIIRLIYQWRGPELGPLWRRKDLPKTRSNSTPLTTWRPRLTMSRPRFKTRRTEDLGQDPHWQDVRSPASWLHLRPVPCKRDPHDNLRLARQVSASHDKPPRTTSLRLARPPSGSDWYVGHEARREHRARAPPSTRIGERVPTPCKYNTSGGHVSSSPQQEP
jgi:hypothetical protein